MARGGRNSREGRRGRGGALAGRLRARWRADLAQYRLYRPALIAACLGTLVSLAAAMAAGQWENRFDRAEFESLAEAQTNLVQSGINEYTSRLTALRTLFESSNKDITRSEYESFSGRLFEAHPGIIRVAWVPRVFVKERGDYEAAATADGLPDFHIKSFIDGAPSLVNEEYYPVYFSTEPKTAVVYGLDYWSYPQRRAALEAARDNDSIAVLRTKFYETRNGRSPFGVMVGVPVFAKGTSRTTIADRRRNLTGFIVGMFDLPVLLQSIRGRSPSSRALALSVSPRGDGMVSSDNPQPSAFWSAPLRIADTDWQLQIRAMPSEQAGIQHPRALALYAAAMATTIFLALYLGLASRNASQLSLANRRVLELAQTDILTRLPNRSFFLSQLAEMNASEQRERFAILLLDLDRFKNVNDSLGHAAGDALLKLVADRLQSTLRSGDVLARLGGDEFAVIQGDWGDQRKAALDLAKRISKLIADPFQLDGHRVEIGTSIGIAFAPEHGNDEEQLLKKADLALYRSKSAGRSCYTVYDEAMSAELEARNTLEGDLRDAIARCQFEIYYQPFYDVETRRRCGVEALIRWRHPVKGLIPPDQFIPLAETTGLIVPLGEWIIARACDDATAWPDDIKVAVNLSPVQFKQAELYDVVQSALTRSGLSPKRLEIEITESVLLEQAVENQAVIDKLKGLGISLALDDFGTGYSSLGSLTSFPFDKIKVDKSFIAKLGRRESAAVISSIVTLARGLGMQVTAEGVETEEQLDQLRTLGANFAQGYLLGRPMPVAQLEQHFQVGLAERDAA